MQVNKDLIKKLRIDRGWTQQHLADAIGLSLRTVQRIEKTGATSIDTVAAFASVFEVEQRTLLPTQDDENTSAGIAPQYLMAICFIAGLVIGATAILLIL